MVIQILCCRKICFYKKLIKIGRLLEVQEPFVKSRYLVYFIGTPLCVHGGEETLGRTTMASPKFWCSRITWSFENIWFSSKVKINSSKPLRGVLYFCFQKIGKEKTCPHMRFPVNLVPDQRCLQKHLRIRVVGWADFPPHPGSLDVYYIPH